MKLFIALLWTITAFGIVIMAVQGKSISPAVSVFMAIDICITRWEDLRNG